LKRSGSGFGLWFWLMGNRLSDVEGAYRGGSDALARTTTT
jgi:hypothetical protein